MACRRKTRAPAPMANKTAHFDGTRRERARRGPLKVAYAQLAQPVWNPEAPAVSEEIEMKHILVVDDEENILTLFEDELTDAGYRVTTASTGQQALDCLEEETPDLVILDIRMPDMHGLEVLTRIRETHKDLPVILCTAVHGLKDDYTVWDARVAAYLTKPIDLDDLVYKVQEVLEKNPSTQGTK